MPQSLEAAIIQAIDRANAREALIARAVIANMTKRPATLNRERTLRCSQCASYPQHHRTA